MGYTFALIRFNIEEIINLIGHGQFIEIAKTALGNPGSALLTLAFLVLLAVILTNIFKEKS